MSAERLALSTHGLKEQTGATASPNQCPAIFAESIGRVYTQVHWNS
jgi:hypothetical protein